MTVYTTSQLTQLLEFAGFKKDSQTLSDMVGICYAESGGDPTKHKTKPPDDSYGLWQINMYGDLGPSRRKQFGISSNDKLLDPETNAKAAYVVYKSQGLNAWTTYKNGEYLKHMDGMTTAEGGNSVSKTIDQFGGISASIDAVGKNLFKGLADGIGAVVALVLLILGVVVLISQTKNGKAAVKTAAKAALL